MQKLSTRQKHLSPAKEKPSKEHSKSLEETWEEYSSFHDSFAELLSYENSRKINSDFWELNYI